MRKRVLIITYYWPPTGGSGVQRWVKFAKYLPQYGWQPVIYTPENPERLARDESLEADVPQEAEVIRKRIVEPYELYRRLKGRSEVNPINSRKKDLKQKVAVWLRGNLCIPDPRASWIRPSVRFLRKYLEEHPVDVIVTSGPPHSMHLIGRGLKRATGVRWIADFRDPWTQMFYFKHLGLTSFSKWVHHRLEQSVLDEADAIISVTPLVREDFEKVTRTPVELITNGFDEDDFPKDAAIASEDRFTIVHTGLFASDGNPTNLWDVLADKCGQDPEFRKKMQIRLAGKVDEEILCSIRERGLEDNLADLGYLPHSLVNQEQRSASVLILPLRQEPEYRKVLPGKIFEYLAARRPVLGIGQEYGAAASVLRECGAGEMYDWDRTEPLRSFVDRWWEQWKEGNFSPLDSDISAYTRKALTERLTNIL